jgi:hypothetical protein
VADVGHGIQATICNRSLSSLKTQRGKNTRALKVIYVNQNLDQSREVLSKLGVAAIRRAAREYVGQRAN